MQGQILNYSVQTNEGVISSDDGNRYTFAGSEWREANPPARGMRVDFEVQGAAAVAVYRALAGAGGSGVALSGTKSKVTAGVLGILLGGLGVHKFYLGYTGPGFAMLGIALLGAITAILVIGFFIAFAIGIIGLIEGIIYLTKSDEEFEELYVRQRKAWF